MSPIETIAEKPTSRTAAHSTMPVAIAPDCEISARSPPFGMEAAKLALSFTFGSEDAEAIGTDEAQTGSTRGCSALRRKRSGTVTETRGNDDGGRRAFGAGLRDRRWNRRRGHRNHRHIGRSRQDRGTF